MCFHGVKLSISCGNFWGIWEVWLALITPRDEVIPPNLEHYEGLSVLDKESSLAAADVGLPTGIRNRTHRKLTRAMARNATR